MNPAFFQILTMFDLSALSWYIQLQRVIKLSHRVVSIVLFEHTEKSIEMSGFKSLIITLQRFSKVNHLLFNRTHYWW